MHRKKYNNVEIDILYKTFGDTNQWRIGEVELEMKALGELVVWVMSHEAA